MIKGLMALFTSGVIFNPMVLLGVVSGIYSIIHFEPEQIRALLIDVRLYLGVSAISAFYTVVFAKVYDEGGLNVDWASTFGKMIWNILRYFMAFILSMSFVMMVSIF